MRIDRQEEFLLTPHAKQAISTLLRTCFPGYPTDQIYYKYPPNFRYLIWSDEDLIGHMGIVARLISFEGEMYPIFGIMDLCIAPAYQQQKLASRLLEELESLSKKSDIDFILLVAKESDLYTNNGFVRVNNLCKWLLLSGNKTLGLVQRPLPDLMVKSMGHGEWPKGEIDLMGPLF